MSLTGEIAHNEQFYLFSQYIQLYSIKILKSRVLHILSSSKSSGAEMVFAGKVLTQTQKKVIPLENMLDYFGAALRES